MKLIKPKDIIITDPYNISKDYEWGDVFCWKDYSIKSNLFSEYLWFDYNQEGVVYEMNKKLNEPALIDIIGASLITDDKIEDFKEKDYVKQSLNKLQESQKRLGTFSPIVGCIGVFILEEALVYNPDFLTGLSIKCYTIIKEFSGRIKIQENLTEDNNKINILGIGNKTFYTI